MLPLVVAVPADLRGGRVGAVEAIPAGSLAGAEADSRIRREQEQRDRRDKEKDKKELAQLKLQALLFCRRLPCSASWSGRRLVTAVARRLIGPLI
jgi:hypothetical protein